MLRVRHPSAQWAPWQLRQLPAAPANIGVNLGAFSDNGNPSVGVTGTTIAPSSINDKIVLSLLIPNANPTALTVTYDGVALTEITSARQTRNNKTLCVFYMDETANRVAGRTVSATWTNTGTQNGGGSLCLISAITPTNTFVVGAPDVVNSTQGANTAPTTGSSGAPSDATANYVAYAVLAVQNNVLAAEAPINGYTAMTPQASNTTRVLVLDAAVREFRNYPVAAQTETWAVTWPGAIAWASAILMFKESVPGAPAISISPLVTGTPAVGSTLSTTDGTWTNTPSSFTYDWQRDVGSSGATWVSIDANQQVTLNGTTSVTVTSIANLHVGDPIYGTNIPAGATISEIFNATTIIISAAATGSGTVTAYFGANNVNSYTVTASDLGCQIRCIVTATNGNGSGTGAPSNAAAGVVPPPAFPTYRVVLNPLAQSDGKVHTSTLALPVLPGETLVYLGGCSVPNQGGDIGSITDPAGNVWRQLVEGSSGAGGATRCVQAFSTVAAAGLAYGSVITTRVKQTTVVGAHAVDSPVINVGDTTGFDSSSSGVFEINGVLVSYTGITATSLTGCGPHAAYSGGEFAGYHGQSPYWYVVAINPGLGATCAFDVAAAGVSAFGATSSSPAVATQGPKSVALGFHARQAVELWTPAAGWTKMFDGPFANAGAPFSGESTYSTSAEGQILTGPQASLTANGTNASNDTLSSLIVVFSIAATVASTARPTFPNPLMGPPLRGWLRSHPAAVLAGVTLTAVSSAIAFAIEATQGIAATGAGALEATQDVTPQVAALILEALQGIAQAGVGPVEATGGISSTGATVLESTQGIAATGAQPIEATQGIVQTAADPIESTQGIAAIGAAVLEALAGIASSGVAPIEALAGIVQSALGPIEALGAATTPVSQTAVLAIESLAAAAQSGVSPLEALAGIAATDSAVVEATKGVSLLAVVPLESTAAVAVLTVTPLEATKGVLLTLSLPIEASGIAAVLRVIAIGSLTTGWRAVGARIDWKTTSGDTTWHVGRPRL